MNGHDRRRQQIIDRIKHTALDLFSNSGVEQVSMDEIASRADVSKVTIYKYFRSKEELHRQVIDLYIDEILAATEKLLESDLDFFEKLKFTMLAKLNSPKVADSQALYEKLEKHGQGGLKHRIKEIMFRFYEQGQKQGYIDKDQSFEMLYLYSEIFEAGFKAKGIDLQPIISDPQAFDQLLQLYYFGVFRNK